MGYGNWDDTAYRAGQTYRARNGIDDFGYTARMRDQDYNTWHAHPSLDPFDVAYRESRDSAEHGNSLPVVVLFDVTGSMGRVPRIMQTKLAKLHGLLAARGYADDPQVCFGAIGDAESDRVPLQIGQFESDNRMDDQLREILLEGGGGGQKSESYELAAYFVARHMVTDAWEKRGKRGYLFLIGDELNKPRLTARHIRAVIGDHVDTDVSVESIYRVLAERWNVYFILPNESSYYLDPEIADHWSGLLGERFLKLEDPGAVCELIALAIGLGEQRVKLDEGLADLRDLGSVAEADAVEQALSGAEGRGPRRRAEGRGSRAGDGAGVADLRDLDDRRNGGAAVSRGDGGTSAGRRGGAARTGSGGDSHGGARVRGRAGTRDVAGGDGGRRGQGAGRSASSRGVDGAGGDAGSRGRSGSSAGRRGDAARAVSADGESGDGGAGVRRGVGRRDDARGRAEAAGRKAVRRLVAPDEVDGPDRRTR
ncbi:hypothetical protein GCM10011591_09440 [Nocardia camponoti]|uniref:VWA domain-containing protein n=1 Tax=Nocardia camponoti TaxID=1616106 RepID=A0A917V5K8_9NOCA|nr:hypothetical protein GCM10011591_09440 [Nocardia camponoti]